ncbi:MAG TPA: PAS domain S-box protein [Pyrinomonadaceae bacterium]|nr:PAS domain S-box protein [Pyrinomonadaceae bacterium]
MLSFSQTPLARYSCAVIIVCIALLATIQIEQLAIQTPFALFFGAVTAAAWLFGRGPAIVAEILSAAGAQFLLMPQLSELQPDASRTLQLVTFLLFGSALAFATSSVRKYIAKAQQSETRFGSLFDHSPFPVFILDVKTNKFITVNKAATTVYGYSHEEFLDLSLKDLTLDDEEFDPGKTEGVGMVRRDIAIAVSKHRRKDGSVFYVELSTQDIEDKNGTARLIHSVDVTERIRTSDALRTSEARLSRVFGSCPVSMAVNRWSDRTFIEVNSEFTELTGWDLDSIKGKTVVDCGLLPEEAENELCRHLSEHNTIIDREVEITTRTGKRRNVIVGAVFVEINDEQRVISSMVDVTELRRAEERHRASEDRLKLVTEKAQVGLVMINSSRRFAFVNSAYAEIFELPTANITGRKVSEVHSTLYDKQIGPSLDRAFAGQSFRYELRCPTLRGTRYYDVRYEPTEVNGEIVSVVAVVTDVTERTRAELAREASEERYRTLFEYSPDGIAIADQDSFYIDANETLCRMLGYTREEFIGLHATNIFIPREVPHLGETLFGLNTDLEYYQEWEYRRKDGSTFPGEVIATVMPDGNTLTVIRDITERKQLEDQLVQAQKMEAIGVLAGGVAHDFNNILTAISGYSDLTLQNMPADDPLRDYILEINHAGTRAAALTTQLLSFSRRRVLTPVVHNLNAAVTDTERMLRHIVKEDIQFRIDLDPQLGNIKVDPSQITQVIVNLVVNAGDAMPNGGTLTITTRNRYLDGDFSHENVVVTSGPFVELTVRDTGIGMDDQTRRRLFEPFFTTKETGKGTGLGLSTVYGIVKQSGGDISVESEPGKGSTFRVYLPHATESSATRTPISSSPGVSSASGTILLVEDEIAVRNLIQSVLTKHGYKVIAVTNGDEALEICRTFADRIHLLLTDMIMPGMNGSELQFAASQIRPDMRTIIMSGYSGHQFDEGIDLGSETAFIEKPFGPDELIEKIRASVGAEDITSIAPYSASAGSRV